MSKEKWADFRIGDLFVPVPTKKLPYKASECAKTPAGDYTLPALTAGVKNQGISGYVPCNEATVLKNCVSVASNGSAGVMFYQDEDFTVLQDAYAIRLKNQEGNRERYLFLITCMQKAIRGKFNWSNKATWAKVKDLFISLPVTSSGTPDFACMEDRIKELEEDRIKELEIYLKVTGLDYGLTSEDRIAVKEMKEGKKSGFRIGDLFTPVNGDTDLGRNDLEDNGISVITAGVKNCGIFGMTGRKAKIIPKNTITVDMFGHPFYRDFQYKMVTHARVFALLPKFKMTRESGLFLSSSLGFLEDMFSYNDMCSWVKIQNLDIYLPVTSTGMPDFDRMERYIRAVEKEVIRRLYEYRGKEIDVIKEAVKEQAAL